MKSFLAFAFPIVLTACAASEPPAQAIGAPTVPAHPTAPPAPDAVRTAIGDVRAIDAATGTVTVALTTGAKSEQTGLGRLERVAATAEQRAAVRVGEVIEFRYRPARPYPQLVSVTQHVHGEPARLPD